MSKRDPVSAAVNAAGAAAALEVWRYAERFDKREQYRPLERLASRVWRAAAEAGCEAANEADAANAADDT
jgi:hypothetical protein